MTQIDDAEVGAYCLYPPRLAAEIDVTEQVEGGQTRYVIRDRVAARYFLLKPTEYGIFCRFDGAHTPNEIAAGYGGGAGPRPSLQSLIKFLTKLDSLGLTARGGRADRADGAGRPSPGSYVTIPLFNPDALLKWLDRRIGRALGKPYIIASFVMMALAALLLTTRLDEIVPYAARILSEYGVATILLFVVTVTAMHEFAHGLACKHFGGDVPEVGVLLIRYFIPALYCNVTDIHRLGSKRERLWVVFAGIFFQLIVGTLGALLWLCVPPRTRLADLGFLLFLAGTINAFINCNPLVKLDGYYALSQLLGVQNLQANSSAYVRSLLARRSGRTAEPFKGPPRPLLYVTYWASSLAYTLCVMCLIVVGVGGWLIDRFGWAGRILTAAFVVLFTVKLWRPILGRVYRSARVKFKRGRNVATAR